MSSVGFRLRRARDRKGLTQMQVMEKTNMKVNNKTLSGYENGVSTPDYESLIVLADLYEVTVSWLLTGYNTNEKQSKHAIMEIYDRLSSEKKKIIDDMIRALGE